MSETVEQKDPKFSGFVYPTENKRFSQMPNDWFDEIVSQIDNVAELKIVLYAFRHTCGFQKPTIFVPLTVDELMNGRTKPNGDRYDRGTGMSEMSVRNGTKKATKHGYIVCDTDESNKGNIKKSYKLHFQEVQSLDPDKPEEQGEVHDLDPQVQSLDRRGTKFREKHLKLIPQASSKTGHKEKERQLNTDRNTGTDYFINKKNEERTTSQEPMSKATEREFRLRAKDWGYTRGDEVERGLDIYVRSKLGDNQFYQCMCNASDVRTMEDFFEKLCRLLRLEPAMAMEG